MNRVAVNAEDAPLPPWSGALCRFALKVLEEIKRDNWELSILLCSDKTITALNGQYRGKEEPTDVLSFSMGGETFDEDGFYLPGDIVISLDALRENARYFETAEDEELRRLLIHGILHLDGMDHETDGLHEPMLAMQEEILGRFKDEIIIKNGEAK
ncbi:MAG: rRNA maturation RNase YbeY [Treponema sp.]|jgi:probable rRNA maturation factor|nr:rRNA maturation RNase YbeY [Treponema sp.]